MRRPLTLLAFSLAFALFPGEVEACSCAPAGPPCKAVWESPLIFAGTVIALDRAPGASIATRVRFRITEAFRGTEQGEIEIHLRGSSCDPPFKMGEAWLVYGFNQWEGVPGWTTSSCSRTRLLNSAAEDLQYLRLPDSQKPPSHISGRVAKWVYDPSPQREGRAVGIPDVRVVVEGDGQKIETKTDPDGRYRFAVGGARSYRVEFGAVEGLLIRGPAREVILPHYLSCGVADAGAGYDGRISGQIVDDKGFPIPFLPIALESSPRYLRHHTVTDAAGLFQFPVRYPGPHFVTPSEEMWKTPPPLPPLNTSPLTVPVSTQVDAGKLRMPASVKLVLVEVVIEDSVGNPASGAHVDFRQPDIYNGISYEALPKADERGRFRISLVAGQRYEVSPSFSRKTPTGSVYEEAVVLIEAGQKPVRIRLAPFR